MILVTTGWCNIDRAVEEFTLSRTTLNFEDKQTGKKANITYLPVTFTVSNANSYDRCYLYLPPNRTLAWISNDQLDKTLNDLSNLTQAADLKKEEEFTRFDAKDGKRRSHNQSLQDLKYKLINALFPCGSPNKVTTGRESGTGTVSPPRSLQQF